MPEQSNDYRIIVLGAGSVGEFQEPALSGAIRTASALYWCTRN